MIKMSEINVDVNDVYSVVKENVYNCVDTPIKINDIKFHHNLHIESILNALKYGLLSNEMKAKIIENRELTEKEIFMYSDDHYVNGKDYISLASTIEDMDKMSSHERLYNTYQTSLSSIIVSKDVKHGRNSKNYYNEFLVQDKIPVELFNSIEIRLLKLFNSRYAFRNAKTEEEKAKEFIKTYEVLREIAIFLKENNLDIPLRESSDVICNEDSNNAITLNPEKIIEMPKLVLK